MVLSAGGIVVAAVVDVHVCQFSSYVCANTRKNKRCTLLTTVPCMMEFGYEVRRGSKRDEQGSGYGDVRIIHVIGDCAPVIVSDGPRMEACSYS